MARCKKCGARITWRRNDDGQWKPCQIVPVYYIPDCTGDTYIISKYGKMIKARKGSEIGTPIRVGHVLHQSVCPNASENWKKIKREIDTEAKEAERSKKKAEMKAKEEQKIKDKVAQIEAAWREQQKRKQLSFFE